MNNQPKPLCQIDFGGFPSRPARISP